jgi:FixJ family two-component response regulator
MRPPVTKTNSQIGTVYVVDDDTAVLKMLQTLISTIGVNVQAFTSAKDFLAAYRPGASECVVCDLRMPDIDGMQLQRRLIALESAPPIIFLTGFAEVDVAVDAMKLGAFDFLQKPFGAQALLGKIQAALEKSRSLHSERCERQTKEARLALLTPRERTIIQHVVEGKSSREISELIQISPRTVDNHRARIMDKLHVDSVVDLVKLFI